MRKTLLAITLLASLFIRPAFAADEAKGVGILDAAGQAGVEIECPVGAANCVEEDEEAENYSVEGTQNFILRLVGGILNFAAIIAVVMLIIAAIRLVTARGSQDALAAAKKHIMWTLAGLVVIILSLLIVQNVTKIIFENTQG